MSTPAPSIFDTLAQQDTQRMQHDQGVQQSKDVFDQLALNNGQATPPPPPPGTPTMGPGPKRGIMDKIAETEVPGTGVTLGEAGKRAGEFAHIAGGTALALGGGPEGGVLSILAKGGRTTEEIAQASKFAHLLDDAHEVEKAGVLQKALEHPVGKALIEHALKGGAAAVGGGAIYKTLKMLGVF